MSSKIFVFNNIGASHKSIKNNLVFSSLDDKFSFYWDFDSIYTVGIHLQIYLFEMKKIQFYLILFKFFLWKIFTVHESQCDKIFTKLGGPHFV